MVRCRQVDRAIVASAISGAIAMVKDQIKKDCQVKLDEDNFLPSDWLVDRRFLCVLLSHFFAVLLSPVQDGFE